MNLQASTNAASRKYICASEKIKLIGTLDGRFPDFGHHDEREMGGLWLHPIKLLDGFWLHFCDQEAENTACWLIADCFTNTPWGNEFTYHQNLGHTPVRITLTQLAPEGVGGMLAAYRFHNTGTEPRRIRTQFLARADLRPVWLSGSLGLQDHPDQGEWLPEEGLFLAKDGGNPWYAAVGCSQPPARVETGCQFGPETTAGQGVSVSLFHEAELAPGGTLELTFRLAGSYSSREDCLAQYRALSSGRDFAGEKRRHWEAIQNRSRLTLRDKRFQEIFDWVKANTQWLAVDAGPHGRGLAAGAPEYLWWFGCDNCYALQGLLAMGDFALCRDTLRLLLRYSQQYNGNGRIVHEVTTYGGCFNLGNTQETAHFVTMVWKYYQWTGDFALVEEALPYLEKSVEWLQAQSSGELFPGGYGIIEIQGLNSELIDSAAYTFEAYQDFAKICRKKGWAEKAERYEALAERIRAAIEEHFWDEQEGLYCDVYTNCREVEKSLPDLRQDVPEELRPEIYPYLDALMERKKPLREKKSGWLLNKSWVISMPMEIGFAPEDRARRALATMDGDSFVGPWGVYLSGLYRDRAMTISTGALAVAQARYGYSDRALNLIERIFAAFGMATPGSLSEMSPDYGCFVQAWTAYAVFVPVVRYFFGIQPDAAGNRLLVAPAMPERWGCASLEHVPVLDGEISVALEPEDGGRRCSVSSTASAPLVFRVPAGCTALWDGARFPAGAEISLPCGPAVLRLEPQA